MKCIRVISRIFVLAICVTFCIVTPAFAKTVELEDGSYAVGVTVEGGSGKAAVTTPCEFSVNDGQAFAILQWSSPNYDYMIVDGKKYFPINKEGNSTFEIPLTIFDEPVKMIADTTAMSTAHEIEYELTFFSDQIIDAKDTPQAKARYSVYMAIGIIAFCLIISRVKKYRKKMRMKKSRENAKKNQVK